MDNLNRPYSVTQWVRWERAVKIVTPHCPRCVCQKCTLPQTWRPALGLCFLRGPADAGIITHSMNEEAEARRDAGTPNPGLLASGHSGRVRYPDKEHQEGPLTFPASPASTGSSYSPPASFLGARPSLRLPLDRIGKAAFPRTFQREAGPCQVNLIYTLR